MDNKMKQKILSAITEDYCSWGLIIYLLELHVPIKYLMHAIDLLNIRKKGFDRCHLFIFAYKLSILWDGSDVNRIVIKNALDKIQAQGLFSFT